MEYSLEPLDCPAFEHSFGPSGYHTSISIGIWRWPLLSLENRLISIPFYVLSDMDQRPTIGNSTLCHSTIDNLNHTLIISPASGICRETVTLPLYHPVSYTHLTLPTILLV